ncbi:MAG: hypothetical protein H0W94_06065 [Actinobacteria bacterium]|nr:hypothetical protein [Actinomycetota bacterium]
MNLRRAGGRRKTGGPVRTWLHRSILGAMMTGVAFVVERRLLKAIRSGGARTGPGGELGPTGSLPAADQVDDEPRR